MSTWRIWGMPHPEVQNWTHRMGRIGVGNTAAALTSELPSASHCSRRWAPPGETRPRGISSLTYCSSHFLDLKHLSPIHFWMINHLKFGIFFWGVARLSDEILICESNDIMSNSIVQGIDEHRAKIGLMGCTWHLASSSVRGLLAAVESLETSSRVFNEHSAAWWHGGMVAWCKLFRQCGMQLLVASSISIIFRGKFSPGTEPAKRQVMQNISMYLHSGPQYHALAQYQNNYPRSLIRVSTHSWQPCLSIVFQFGRLDGKALCQGGCWTIHSRAIPSHDIPKSGRKSIARLENSR